MNNFIISEMTTLEIEELKNKILNSLIDNLPKTYNIVNFNREDRNSFLKNCIYRFEEIEKNIIRNGFYQYDVTVIDLIIMKFEGDRRAEFFLSYIDSLVMKVYNKVDSKFKKKIKEIAKRIIVNFDKKGSRYMDQINELSVIDFFLNSVKEAYIVDIEKKLSNGKTADLEICLSGINFLADILSIRVNESKVYSSESLETFLHKRFEKKIRDKTINTMKNERLYLIPVIYNLSELSIDYFRGYLNNSYEDVIFLFATIEYRSTSNDFFSFKLDCMENIISEILKKKKINP